MSNPTYSQISFKASHNSYDRDESTAQQLDFNTEKPYDCGCMALEFDIWRHTSFYTPDGDIEEGFFTVSHLTPGKTTLKYFLDQMTSWHKDRPNHLPILVTLDIKSSDGGYDNFHLQIDTYLKKYFNDGKDLVFKPSYFADKTGKDLCGKVIAHGWPQIMSADMSGKFIFCLSGNTQWKAEYTRHELLEKRYCFSDVDQSDKNEGAVPPTDGNFVFFNFNIYHDHRKTWMRTIPPFADKNLVVRAYEANSQDNWNDCLTAKVSAIATNKISNHDWAKVSTTGQYKLK